MSDADSESPKRFLPLGVQVVAIFAAVGGLAMLVRWLLQ